MITDLLTLEVTAKLLGRSTRSLRDTLKTGGFCLPVVQISQRDRRFRRIDVEALLGRALTEKDLLPSTEMK